MKQYIKPAGLVLAAAAITGAVAVTIHTSPAGAQPALPGSNDITTVPGATSTSVIPGATSTTTYNPYQGVPPGYTPEPACLGGLHSDERGPPRSPSQRSGRRPSFSWRV
jgi:hypothetical protein